MSITCAAEILALDRRQPLSSQALFDRPYWRMVYSRGHWKAYLTSIRTVIRHLLVLSCFLLGQLGT